MGGGVGGGGSRGDDDVDDGDDDDIYYLRFNFKLIFWFNINQSFHAVGFFVGEIQTFCTNQSYT